MRILRHIIATLALCAVFCVPSHADSIELDTLASHMAGRSVSVACFTTDDTSDEAGYVDFSEPTVIHLDGTLCGSLQNVLTPGPRTLSWASTFDGSQAIGYAFLALYHEATHIREYYEQGVDVAIDEGETECYAYRNAWPMTKILGLPWKTRELVYEGAKYYHMAKPTTGKYGYYRSVC